MALSDLPLSYCTNVHPGRTVAEVESGLDRYTVPVQQRLGRPIAAGLWLARSVVDELLQTPDGARRFAEGLEKRDLVCHTLNAFPFGDFHSPRVKENVYLPDWTTPERLSYTLQCAKVLAELLPADGEGSISTLPLGFKGFDHPADYLDRAAAGLVHAAVALRQLHEKTGKLIRLAIEPEPLCVLETTAEVIDFFRRLHHHAEQQRHFDAVATHVGLCYDVCHQAVEFENVAISIRELDDAQIRINKVHISCAIELINPRTNTEGRNALLRFIEPRYLHQTTALTLDGEIARETDLSEEFVNNPPPEFATAPAWRVHFHVPVDAHRLGFLSTTRADLIRAIDEVAELDYAPDLEVETYTWDVMPGAAQDLVQGLSREMISTYRLLDEMNIIEEKPKTPLESNEPDLSE